MTQDDDVHCDRYNLDLAALVTAFGDALRPLLVLHLQRCGHCRMVLVWSLLQTLIEATDLAEAAVGIPSHTA